MFGKKDNKMVKAWFALLAVIASVLLAVSPLNDWITGLSGTNWIQFLLSGVILLLAGAILCKKPKMKWLWFTILGIYVAVWHANPPMWSFMPNVLNIMIGIATIALGAWCWFSKK